MAAAHGGSGGGRGVRRHIRARRQAARDEVAASAAWHTGARLRRPAREEVGGLARDEAADPAGAHRIRARRRRPAREEVAASTAWCAGAGRRGLGVARRIRLAAHQIRAGAAAGVSGR
ncbi:hypothetical protein BRADI_1g15725v3 [Brachypodium distachyon]|uniref:Uncharacterized protein n=1 Tax=Brachypodium distachyon TaxID=15368 RepID=A0A0Q3GVD5_BRADI|nr:hypothetical protein BRADI_1g15725v3 [Brachypodium distachyon]